MIEKKNKPTFFELDRYSLFAPMPGNKRSTLSFSERDKYPRLTVFTNIETDNGGKGFISAALDIDHFNMFLARLERIARSPTLDAKEKVTIKHWPRDKTTNKITGELEVTSEIWYGKNSEGVVWISVVAPNRPKVVFEIILSEYHEFFNEKGEKLSKSEGSIIRTISMINALKQMFTSQCLTFRDTSIPRENKGPYSQRQNATNNFDTNTTVLGSIGIDDDFAM